MVERRYSLDDVPIEITIVVLREVKEVSRPVVVDGDVDSWQLVEPHIMVAHHADDGHQVAQSGCELSVHPQEVIPGVGAGWHVIVIRDISSHHEEIGLQSCGYSREIDGCSCVA
jgi:hypothetical protein